MQRKKRKLFFSVCPLTVALILLSANSLQAAQPRELVPVGRTVGVTLDTKGLLVLGTGTVDGEDHQIYAPCKGVLQVGDLILKADGQPMENKEAFLEAVARSGGEKMTLLLERKGENREVAVTPVFSAVDHAYKIGAWVRDSIQGIGTVTWYDPQKKTFGALGHGVYDVDTGSLMEIREGALAEAELTEVIKGKKGTPGELSGKVELSEKFARIEKNTEAGIYGSAAASVFVGEAMPVAAAEEVKKGKATLLSDLEGKGVQAYELEIEGVGNGGKSQKDLMIRITDERLLSLTGGIIQGMSGSPIIQEGKLVGAVTYVMVNDPARGYGIFAENMLEAAE